MRTWLLVALCVPAAACLRSTTYKCSSNDQCSTGVCESTGFCSFTDSACPDGRRYGDYAGDLSNKCVGDAPPDLDGGIDTGDGPGSDSIMNCPNSYAVVSGQSHRYRVLNGSNYASALSTCAADGPAAYLAVPDDATELAAILQEAQANTWVGIDDRTTEGTFVTANGGTFASNSPLWDSAAGEPNNGPANQGDCAVAIKSSSKLVDDKCANSNIAVCECEP